MKKNTSLLLMLACCTVVVPAYSQVAPDNTLYLSADACATMLADTPATAFPSGEISFCYKPAATAVGAHICKVSGQLKLVGTAVGSEAFEVQGHAPPPAIVALPGIGGLNIPPDGNVDGSMLNPTQITSSPRVNGDNLGWQFTGVAAGLAIANTNPIRLSDVSDIGLPAGATLAPATTPSGLAIDLAGIQMVVTASPPAVGDGCDVITVSDPSIPAVNAAPAGYRIGIRAFPAAVPTGTIAGLGVMLFAVAGIGAYLRRRRS